MVDLLWLNRSWNIVVARCYSSHTEYILHKIYFSIYFTALAILQCLESASARTPESGDFDCDFIPLLVRGDKSPEVRKNPDSIDIVLNYLHAVYCIECYWALRNFLGSIIE